MTYFVPGAQEKDPAKVIRSLQQAHEKTAANEADIATNTADIATNAADIATNTADIATNAADIAANAAAIAALPAPASQSDQETATDTAKPVTPGRQQYHPSAAKAWVKFAGSGANGAQTINASYNVSDVSRTGAGLYTVSFSTSFSSANYAAVPNGYASVVLTTQIANASQATGSVGLVFSNNSGTQVDPVVGYLIAFGDL